MAGLGDVFSKGSTAEQFLIWGVLQQLLQPLLQPLTVELSKLVLSATPVVPIDPGLAAQGVARGFIDAGTGQDKANDTGIGGADFHLLTQLAQAAPDLSLAIEALRRGLIAAGGTDPKSATFGGALTDAGIAPQWHPVIEKLVTSIPSTAEVMNAWLEGQITEGEAAKRWKDAGGDPTWFQTAYNANGEAPTPVQALELLNRGIIPEGGTGPAATSYEQAFLEGPWRNKWLPAFKALRAYLPPPRTITAMVREGSLTHAEGARFLVMQGLTPTLAAAYLSGASHTKAEVDKALSKADTLTLYRDRLISRTDAQAALVHLKYTAHDAGLLLDLADARLAAAQLTTAVSRVRALYVAGHITEQAAQADLAALHVPAAQVVGIVDTWKLTHRAEVKTLSAAQITHAAYYEFITVDDARARLEHMGYSPFDAWVLVSLQLKKAQPNKPAEGV